MPVKEEHNQDISFVTLIDSSLWETSHYSLQNRKGEGGGAGDTTKILQPPPPPPPHPSFSSFPQALKQRPAPKLQK